MQRYEKDNLPTLERVRELLRETVLEVGFIKRNGEQRMMLATLDPDFLPDNGGSFTGPQHETNVVTVWDLEEGNWRSFRMDSVVYMEHD